MQLAARVLRQEAIATEAEDPIPAFTKTPKKLVRWRWYSYLLRVLSVLRVTSLQMLLTAADELRRALPAPTRTRSRATTARSKIPTVIASGRGEPLSRSKGIFPLDPEDCPHQVQYLKARSNIHSKWIACVMCGSRWRRLENVGNTAEASGGGTNATGTRASSSYPTA